MTRPPLGALHLQRQLPCDSDYVFPFSILTLFFCLSSGLLMLPPKQYISGILKFTIPHGGFLQLTCCPSVQMSKLEMGKRLILYSWHVNFDEDFKIKSLQTNKNHHTLKANIFKECLKELGSNFHAVNSGVIQLTLTCIRSIGFNKDSISTDVS